MSLSTHILDTALGLPAVGVAVSLALYDRGEWTQLHEACTDQHGRVVSLLLADYRRTGERSTLRLRFATEPYFAAQDQVSLYPYIDIVFQMEAGAHYHIPLLLTANGYTTYRGS